MLGAAGAVARGGAAAARTVLRGCRGGGAPRRGAAGEAGAAGAAKRRADGLRGEVGEELWGRTGASCNLGVREERCKGESYLWAADGLFPPDVVAFPETTEDVAALVNACARLHMPVVPAGACTSLEGHLAAFQGGLCVDLRRMAGVVRVGQEDMDCTVQAGVTRLQLDRHLRDTGLFFPVDPGADATLGGMASTRASGTNAVRYGTMLHNVLGLTAVLADGSVMRTGGRARKSSTGYDLTRLLLGAEGTLGIITELTLRLHGRPEATSAAVCGFDDLEAAVDTVVALTQCGVPVARAELLDAEQVAACNRFSGLSLQERPTLFFEFHGTEASVREAAEAAAELARAMGGGDFEWSVSPEERDKLWKARHDAWYAALALRPGSRGMPTDACVPMSELAHTVVAAKRLASETGLIAPLAGHVGDGNFHLLVLVDESSPDEVRRAKELSRAISELAVAAGGTCSGEHGIGYGKLGLLPLEHDPAALRMMASIKRALDPAGIMNPGKLGSPAAMGLTQWQ